MLGQYASRFLLILARWMAWLARPLENAALFSLRAFSTPRGPVFFLAFMVLLIGALTALIFLAPGPGSAAWIKILFGIAAFAVFGGYLRAYFATRSETEAELAGLRPGRGYDVAGVGAGQGVLSSFDLALFLTGLAAAHTAVASGLLEGGLGPQAFDAAGADYTPSGLDWLLYAAWASLGAFDLLDLLPRPYEEVYAFRVDWGWAAIWLFAYRLILLGVVFSLAARAFTTRRLASIALARPGVWPEKTAHLDRLGVGGFYALAASLSDPDPQRREDAAGMLGAIQTPKNDVAFALIPALSDPSEAVRERAAASLGAIGPSAAEASPALTGRLFDASRAVRREAAAALGAIAIDRPELTTPTMAALASAIPTEPAQLESADTGGLAAIAVSLAQIAMVVGEASEQAVAAVDRLRGHRDAQVRQAASEAYGRLMGAAQSKARAEAERRAEAEAAEREAHWTGSQWPPEWGR